jgi:hypothetical protein
MADSNFRSYRSHDPLARPGERAPASAQIADPLAELARLIGQTDAADGFGRGAGGAADPAAYEPEPAADQDWAANDRYAEGTEPARETYGAGYQEAERYEEEFVAPPREPFPAPRLNGGGDDSRRYAPPQPRARDDVAPAQEFQIPAFLPRGHEDRYEYDEEQSGSDDQAYASDDYEDEAPGPRRRGGMVLVAAILGLAVLGTAGAFAYRSMFGGSMLPSLPPIIKADTGPTKIMPNAGSTSGSASNQAGVSGNGVAEKLVSREEKPVDVPPPVSAAPRVVSTIPIFPAPDSQSPGGPASAVPNVPVPVQSAPPPANAPVVPLASASPPYAPVASAEPKKIHTVAIRPDQSGGLDAMPVAVPPPSTVASAPASVRAAAPPRPAAPPAAVARPAPAPQSANAPLSILPGQADRPMAPPPRTHTALAEPTPLSPSAAAEAPSAPGGGYAVQVTSQRSEADAQTAFRALRAKYPTQLGGHEPIVRRADLGTKGVFYRALVGPFASMEQAAGVCSSLKAAGGTCIVQRN